MENLSLDEKVVVRNLCAWDLYFARINTNGDIKISAKGTVRISREEIQSQVYNGNKLFVGTDGRGKHARVLIEDEATRILVGFEDVNNKQIVLDQDYMAEIFKIKGKKEFEQKVSESVQTQAEKFSIIDYARKTKFNDFAKVKFLEDYTGYKFDEV